MERDMTTDTYEIDQLRDRAEYAENLIEPMKRAAFWHGFFAGCAVLCIVIGFFVTIRKARADDIVYYPSPRQFEIAARVASGEARGSTDMAIAAVCSVMLNRTLAKRRGKTIDAVALWPVQFSSALLSDPNYTVIMRPRFNRTKAYKRVSAICATTVRGRLDGYLRDITNGADHFHSGPVPYWAKGRKTVAQIGPFKFYRLWHKTKSLERVHADPLGMLVSHAQ